jgi:uncharacterized protein
MYFYREIEKELLLWKNEDDKKPLLVRGARQVGKSSTIRSFGKSFLYFLEINFEERLEYSLIFENNLSPALICEQLSALTGVPIVAGKTLLFFDEIQSCPRAINSLRFFYEQMPALHVIATGSLLEFALADLPTFGVGRIRSMFMYPFSFEEFLMALEESQLAEIISNSDAQNPIFEVIHNKAIHLMRKFFIIGGMPEAVSVYAKTKDLLKVQKVLSDINISYRIDFAKYKKRVPEFRINDVLSEIVKQVGGKFSYTSLSTKFNNGQVKEAIELLKLAGLVYSVTHSAANGIPIGADLNHKKTKFLIFDTGLYLNILGLHLSEIILLSNTDLINKGNIAELFAGLEIVKRTSTFSYPALYYWHREAKSSQAKLDYVIQKNDLIIPIEIKACKTGAMKSLHLFMKEKNSKTGIRIALENFSEFENIKVYPLYATRNIF